jgi:hypothetical protein
MQGPSAVTHFCQHLHVQSSNISIIFYSPLSNITWMSAALKTQVLRCNAVSWGMWLLMFEEMYCLHLQGQALFLDYVTLNIKCLWPLTHWHCITSQNCIFNRAPLWAQTSELSFDWMCQNFTAHRDKYQWPWIEYKVNSDKVLITACPVQEQTPLHHCSYSSTATKRFGRHCNFWLHAVETTHQSSNFQCSALLPKYHAIALGPVIF